MLGTLFVLTLGMLDGITTAAAASSNAAQLKVDTSTYQLMSSERVGRTEYRYSYRVRIVNSGPAVKNVRGHVTSSAAATIVMTSDVDFGDVASGAAVVSSTAFVIQQDRSIAFDPASLTWSVSFDTVPVDAVAAIVIDKPWLFFTIAGQSAKLSANVTDARGSPLSSPVAWHSTAPAIISVDAQGHVSALKIGSAQVYATAEGIRSTSTFVVVAQPQPGALLVTDAQVVSLGKFVSLAPGQTPGAGSTYEVTLKNVATPTVGQVLLAAESAPIAGIVAATRSNGANLVVTVALAPIYELFAQYNISEAIDLSAYPLVIARPEADTLANSEAHIVLAKQTVRPNDIVEPFQALSCSGGIDPSFFIEAPTVKFAWHNGETLLIADSPGFSRHILEGQSSADVTLQLKLKAGITLKGKCEAAAKVNLPVLGWASVIVMPAVRFGIGASLSGSILAVDGEFSVTGSLGHSERRGWECANAACQAINEFKPENHLTVKDKVPGSLPTVEDMKVKLEAQVYGLVGLDLAFVAGTLDFQVLEAKYGPKQTFDLQFAEVQAEDPASASSYALTLDGTLEPGSGLKEAIKLLVKADFDPVKFQIQLPTVKLSESPKGTLTISSSAIKLGTAVDFEVKLDPATIDYFLLGYNVQSVQLYRKRDFDEAFMFWKTIEVTATNQDTFVYHWEPRGPDIVSGNTKFAAFVETLLPIGPLLEINPNSIQTAAVACFPSGAKSGTQKPATMSASAIPGETTPEPCAETWKGISTFSSFGDSKYKGQASVTWTRDTTSTPQPGLVEYVASGQGNVNFTVVQALPCTVTPTSFVINRQTGIAILTVDYTSDPPRYIWGPGGSVFEGSLSCFKPPDDKELVGVTWLSSDDEWRNVGGNGNLIQGTITSEEVKSSYSFSRP